MLDHQRALGEQGGQSAGGDDLHRAAKLGFYPCKKALDQANDDLKAGQLLKALSEQKTA